MDRSTFLRNQWTAYPCLPKDAVLWGRLISIQQNTARLLRDDQEQEFELLNAELLREGDWIAVDAAGVWTLLAPNTTDRGVSSSGAQAETLRLWSQFLVQVRQFFLQQKFLEVMTPGLVVCPGTEPSLDVFSTEFIRGSDHRTYFLPTSPELHLKKALARGWSRLFEIKSCFRNGEITAHHQPEFTMIEWYRAGERLDVISDDVIRLIENLRSSNGPSSPLFVDRFTMAELFLKELGEVITPQSTVSDYEGIARRAGLDVRPGMGIDDLFFLIFVERIEAGFDSSRLVFVRDWPPFQAALARLTSDGWGDRFEVYWQRLELANAFHELNDPVLQRARFTQDLKRKQEMGKASIPLDEEFLKSLEAGMPPASGIALGLERLFMAIHGIANIAQLKAFPYR